MKVGDITKAVMTISGVDYDSLDSVDKDLAKIEVQFAIDHPGMTPGQWHKKVYPETPYKTVKAKDKAMYKTILTTINALKDISGGSDEKGDFVECESIEHQEPDYHPNVATDWGINGLNLHTKSTPKGTTENM